jgi:pyruvate,water dikinase
MNHIYRIIVTWPATIRALVTAVNRLTRVAVPVTRFTLPDLVPYFERISALVTDEGGAASHAATMAREARLPAVTGCGDATSVIRSGDVIQVDGDLGVVMRVSDQ